MPADQLQDWVQRDVPTGDIDLGLSSRNVIADYPDETLPAEMTEFFDSLPVDPAAEDELTPAAHIPANDDTVIKFHCDDCGKKLKTTGAHRDRTLTCKHCRSRVPAPRFADDPRVYYFQQIAR